MKAGGCSGLSYDMSFDNKLNEAMKSLKTKGLGGL